RPGRPARVRERGRDVREPEAEPALERHVPLERARHVDRIPETDHVADLSEQLLPEGQRDAGPRVLPAPELRVAELLLDERSGPLPLLGELLRPLPAGRE